MTAITENSTVQIRIPVAPKSSFDALKERGVVGWDETSETATVCPDTGADYKRLVIYPSDLPNAGSLSGSETFTVVQGGAQRSVALSAIGGGSGSSTELAGLADVHLDTVMDGHQLVYDSDTSKWVNGAVPLVLGEASDTAYRGDRGAAAYDHSHASGNPHSTTAAQVGAVAKSGDTMTGPLVAPSLTASNITEGQIVLGGASGVLKSESGLRYANSFLTVGDATGSALVFVDGAPSGNSGMFLQAGGITRWGHLRVATSQSWILRAHDALGATIDSPISIINAAGGEIILGGSTARPVRLTGILRDAGGVQRMSEAGRIDASSLYNSAWGGSGIRPLLTDNAGMGYATDAATFRATLGVQASLGYTPVNKAGDTMTGPLVVGGAGIGYTPSLMSDGGYGIGVHDGSMTSGYRTAGFKLEAAFGAHPDRLNMFYLTDNMSGRYFGGYFGFDGSIGASALLQLGASSRTQLVGARKTGWSAATGTASRSTFATSSVTLPQLAERVKALLDDLISHGLIGA